VFERKKSQHDQNATSAGIITGQVTEDTFEVLEVMYGIHVKRGAPPDAPRTLRVDYRLGFNRWQSEWICLEHSGFARQKAEAWWLKRSAEPIPDDVEVALAMAQAGCLATPSAITIRSVAGEEFDRIVAYEWRNAETPEPEYAPVNDEVPF